MNMFRMGSIPRNGLKCPSALLIRGVVNVKKKKPLGNKGILRLNENNLLYL